MTPRKVSMEELEKWAAAHLKATDAVVLEVSGNAWLSGLSTLTSKSARTSSSPVSRAGKLSDGLEPKGELLRWSVKVSGCMNTKNSTPSLRSTPTGVCAGMRAPCSMICAGCGSGSNGFGKGREAASTCFAANRGRRNTGPSGSPKAQKTLLGSGGSALPTVVRANRWLLVEQGHI